MNSQAEPNRTSSTQTPQSASREAYLNEQAAKRIERESYPVSWFWAHPPAESYPNRQRLQVRRG